MIVYSVAKNYYSTDSASPGSVLAIYTISRHIDNATSRAATVIISSEKPRVLLHIFLYQIIRKGGTKKFLPRLLSFFVAPTPGRNLNDDVIFVGLVKNTNMYDTLADRSGNICIGNIEALNL
jgi:hypothetical protein